MYMLLINQRFYFAMRYHLSLKIGDGVTNLSRIDLRHCHIFDQQDLIKSSVTRQTHISNHKTDENPQNNTIDRCRISIINNICDREEKITSLKKTLVRGDYYINYDEVARRIILDNLIYLVKIFNFTR